MRPFRPTGPSNSGMWGPQGPRNGFPNQQPSNFWNEQRDSSFFQFGSSESDGYDPFESQFETQPPSFWSRGEGQPMGRGAQPRGGMLLRGRGAAQPGGRGAAGRGAPQRGGRGAAPPRGRGALASRGRVAVAKPAGPTKKQPSTVKAVAAKPVVSSGGSTGPVTLETLATRVGALEKNFEVLRGMHGQIFKLQSDVSKLRNEVTKTATTATKRPAQEPAGSARKVQKLDSPFKSCIQTYSEDDAMFFPVSSTEGMVVVTGHSPFKITPDDFFIYTRAKFSFDGMITQKVSCDIAHVTFEDGTTKDCLLKVMEAQALKDQLAVTMKHAGMEGKIEIKSPELAVLQCFRKKDNDWFEVTPSNFYMNKVPLTTFENFNVKTRVKFIPDFEAWQKEGKFVCKVAWDRDHYPFERPVETESLAEVSRTDTGRNNCRLLTGKYKGCVAQLTAEAMQALDTYDIVSCDVQIGEDSNLQVLNYKLIPTKKLAQDLNGSSVDTTKAK